MAQKKESTLEKKTSDFLSFLDASPTPYHAAKWLVEKLKLEGFSPLEEDRSWKLEPQQSYFLVKDASLVAAFRLPQKAPKRAILLASHLDSPALKLKPCAVLEHKGIWQLSTEVYGAPHLYTWFDRELMVAGRIFFANGNSQLVAWDQDPVILPSLALHLDKEVTEKGFIVRKQEHLKPALSSQRLAEKLKKTSGFDLFLAPLQKSACHGPWITAYRLDNLSSAYAAFEALRLTKPSQETLKLAIFWDHEEVGSKTALGADSCFLNQVLERISLAFSMDREAFFQMKTRSLCASGDVTHGYHPNFPEKYDAENAPHLGKGVALKYNANQKYATDAARGAALLALCKKRRIPLQTFASRSDIPSGSTVGPLMAATLGIATLDLGVPLWAMHSIRETLSTQDQVSLALLFQTILEEER